MRLYSLLLVFTMIMSFFPVIPSYAAGDEQTPATVRIDPVNNPYVWNHAGTDGAWNNKDNSTFPFFTFSNNSGWWSNNWEWMYDDTQAGNIGQYVEFTFTGTTVSLEMVKFEHAGKVNVSIDGGEIVSVDTYAPGVTEGNRYVDTVFERSGLSAGQHTLRVEVAGRNADIEEWAITGIRAFEYTPCEAPDFIMVDKVSYPFVNNDGITSGSWQNKKGGQFPFFSFSTDSGWWSDNWEWMYVNATGIGDYTDFSFTGSHIALYMGSFENSGIVKIYVDSVLEDTVDTYDADVEDHGNTITAFEKDGLSNGIHKLRIEVAGMNEAIPDWAVVAIKGFECNGVATESSNWDGPGIRVTSMPYKKSYTIGSSLNLNGLEVTYYDGTHDPAPIAVTPGMVSGFDSEEAGTKTITITHEDYTASFDVKVHGKLIMVTSPSYYSDIHDDEITVEFNAPGLTHAEVKSLHAPDGVNNNPYGYMKTVASGISLDANDYGKGTFTFDAADFPNGPIAIHIKAWNDSGDSDDCYLQLVNYNGTDWDGGPSNTIGTIPEAIEDMEMDLVFIDEFTEMPTITYTGNGTDKYAAAKPDPRGWPEYSSSKFAPPHYSYRDVVEDYSPFAITGSQYMRLETKDWGTVIEPNWGQTYTTGFLASMGQDGTGFVTQPGAAQYFETRVFLPPNPGLWPAFWTLSPYDPDGRPGYDETDIFEAYMGGNVNWFSQGHHTWGDDYGGVHGGGAPVDTKDFGAGVNLNEGWHTFGALVTEDATYFYFDDKYIEGSEVPTEDRTWTVGNYFMVNSAFRDTDADKFPGGFQRYGNTAEMYVDWVRVFQVQNTGFNPMFTKTKVTPGETVSLDILRADDVKGLSGTYTIDMPQGWSVVSGGTFEAGSSKDTIVLNVPEDFSEFKGVIRITPVAGATGYDTETISFTTLGLYAAEIYPMLNDSGSSYDLNLKFNNFASDSFNNIVITGEGPDGWSQTRTISTVGANSSKAVSFQIASPDLYQASDYTFEIQLTDDYSFTLNRRVTGLVAQKAESPITIDGNIRAAQWNNAMTVALNKQSQTSGTWNGIDDLSATAQAKWDDGYLYLAVEVKDDTHSMQETKIADAWRGDSLQISFDPARAFGNTAGGPHLSYVAALNSSTGAYGIAVDRCDYGELGQVWSQLLTDSKCVVKRDEARKTTTYTLAFAWSDILPSAFTGTKDLGIALVVNDNDGSARKGWIKYMDGIATSKDPLMFGDLMLYTAPKRNDSPTPDSDTPTNAPVKSNTGSAPVNPQAGGTVGLGTKAVVEIPAGALNGTTTQQVNVKTSNEAPAASSFRVLGNVYTFSVNQQESYRFNQPVTLTFEFDPGLLSQGEAPTVFYFNTALQLWVPLGGAVLNNRISVQVDHFTDFVVFATKPHVFLDVTAQQKNYDAIREIDQLGGISGYINGNFGPDDYATRADFITIMSRVMRLEALKPDKPTFNDVKPTDWFYGYIEASFKKGLIKGSAGVFNPRGYLTREQMIVILMNAFGKTVENAGIVTSFADDRMISSWAKAAIATAEEKGLINEKLYGDRLDPQGEVTRAEACRMIMDFIKNR